MRPGPEKLFRTRNRQDGPRSFRWCLRTVGIRRLSPSGLSQATFEGGDGFGHRFAEAGHRYCSREPALYVDWDAKFVASTYDRYDIFVSVGL